MVNTEKLEFAIGKSGIKKQFLADKLGISTATFVNKLSGKTRFYAEEAILLLKLLQINPDEMTNYFNEEVERE